MIQSECFFNASCADRAVIYSRHEVSLFELFTLRKSRPLGDNIAFSYGAARQKPSGSITMIRPPCSVLRDRPSKLSEGKDNTSIPGISETILVTSNNVINNGKLSSMLPIFLSALISMSVKLINFDYRSQWTTFLGHDFASILGKTGRISRNDYI